MIQANILEAKTSLPKLVKLVETGAEDRVIISRYGKPVAQLCPLDDAGDVIFGIVKGKFDIPDDIDVYNDEIAELLGA